MRPIAPLLTLALVPLAFFMTGFFTLGDYGVNVDEPLHFMRGQAYLNYYLSGSRDYANLDGFNAWVEARKLQQVVQRDFNREAGITPKEVENLEAVEADAAVAALASQHRFSVYQEPTFTADTFLTKDVGHPPLNGILAAATNKVFYQELGWLGDIPSYHLFEIVIATLGILLVMVWAYLEFGFVAALVAGLALALHPMYLGESRFNIKDPIETFFFAATLFAIWRAITLGRERLKEDAVFKWLLAGGVAFGAALATKFNALFILPIVGLWFISVVIESATPWLGVKGKGLGVPTKTKPALTLHASRFTQVVRQWFNIGTLWGIPSALLLAALVVYASWPNLWGDTLGYLRSVIDFYVQLGTSEQYTKDFLTSGGWNLYPFLDVILRAPLVTLILFGIGIAGFVRYWRQPQFATLLLWAIWLVIPILRVSLPGKALYGATRQIMEYLPALALFAGLGASMIVQSVTNWLGVKGKGLGLPAGQAGVPTQTEAALTPHASRFTKIVSAPTIVTTVIVLLYAPIVITLTRLHPNPQLFYNSLIGGLPGAYAMGFPSWNNTMNNAYTVGVDWINKHVEPGSRLSLLNALLSSLPPGRLRRDIQFSNFYFSGPLQEGEYIMELEPIQPTSFIPKYVERFLDPVFTYQVDGVPLLRIWHNDGKHTKRSGTIAPDSIAPTKVESDGKSLILDFGTIHEFHRLELVPAEEGSPLGDSTPCVALTEGALSISTDGKTWNRLENVPYVGVNRLEFQQHTFPDYLFAGDHLRFINIGPNANACLLNPKEVKGWVSD